MWAHFVQNTAPMRRAAIAVVILVSASAFAAGPRAAAAATCGATQSPSGTLYLPNVTKTLGGQLGWVTPFIVQNVGTAATTLEVAFYGFATGSLVTCRAVGGLAPGASYADVPNDDTDLPDDAQFSVVVRSFGAPVVAVVNEQRGSGNASEAMAYTGFTSGATRAFLPNVARRFYGYDTPFIVQDVGALQATVTIVFASFDGTSTLALVRSVQPGRSIVIDPDTLPGLRDATQYSVAISSDQPVATAVNASQSAAAPVSYSYDALASGAAKLYAPFVVKNDEIGRSSPVVVQNVGSASARPTLAFTSIGSFTLIRTFTGPVIDPGRSWVFDPRFEHLTLTPCGAAGSAACLADGTYSLVIDSPGATIAAVVLPTGPTVAGAYTASGSPAARTHLPNVTKRLGGDAGWTTPIVLQSAQASRATLRWRRFADGTLVLTQVVALPIGEGSTGALLIDPRDIAELPDGQYSVVIDAENGPAAAIVIEVAEGGDDHMIYEGLPAP